MTALIETSQPYSTDGSTYGYDRTKALLIQRGLAAPSRVIDSLLNSGVIERPAVTELAAVGTGPTARRAASRAHKSDLTATQHAVLGLAVTGTYGRVHVGRYVGQNVTAATIRALANKGYGRALTAGTLGAGWSHRRRHEVVAFEINDLGRRALAEHRAVR